jgi:hypothetical protein
MSIISIGPQLASSAKSVGTASLLFRSNSDYARAQGDEKGPPPYTAFARLSSCSVRQFENAEISPASALWRQRACTGQNEESSTQRSGV